MLLRRSELERIQRGEVQLLFRCWERPTVKSGGSLLTAIGKLRFLSVEEVERTKLTEQEARRAGHASLSALLAELAQYPRARVFRIELGAIEPDPRIALRNEALTITAAQTLAAKLAGLDRRAPAPWTRATLEVIERLPETRAASLAREVGQERESFKLNVRKLKNLGLTESLELGYRLSPRGQGLLDWLRAQLESGVSVISR